MSQAVSNADEARHRLYEIMKEDVSFEEKARQALALGTAYLGVDTGFVSHVDERTDHYETVVSTDGDDGLVPAGVTTDLSGTYCRHTLERDSPLAAHDVSTDDTLVEVRQGLHCYHGTTLTVGDETYGTVCFVAGEPREEPFSDAETMFAELVGRLLEHELEHERQQDELARQTSLVNVLDRVLRHNIRNDMTVIKAHARLHADEHGCEECELILQKADDLVELSETARHLGKILDSKFERRRIDVVALARDLVAEAAAATPSASIVVDGPEELTVSALPGLEQALWELIENATQHTGEKPSIRVSIRDREETVEISVIDDGPGLPQSEQDALRAGTETPLVHGSGLGLWMVYWVVTSHGGELAVDTSDGTSVTLSLPHTPVAVDERNALLSRARDRYRAVFEHATAAMVLVNEEGRVVDANDEAADLLGREPSVLEGVLIDELYADNRADGPSDTDTGRVELHRPDGTRHSVTYDATTEVYPGLRLVVFHSL